MVSAVPVTDSFATAPASLPAAAGPHVALGSPAQAAGESGGFAEQPEEQEAAQHQTAQQQSRAAIAIVPGAGALVPRASPIYHIGSLPTLFESPSSSEEVHTCSVTNALQSNITRSRVRWQMMTLSNKTVTSLDLLILGLLRQSLVSTTLTFVLMLCSGS